MFISPLSQTRRLYAGAMPAEQIIHVHPEAPPKPAEGTPCNGCGLCCLAEPCPIGMVISRKRVGACVALQWAPEARQYRCGVLVAAQRRAVAAPSGPLGWPARWWALVWQRWVRRHIASGVGCDANFSAHGVSSPDQG